MESCGLRHFHFLEKVVRNLRITFPLSATDSWTILGTDGIQRGLFDNPIGGKPCPDFSLAFSRLLRFHKSIRGFACPGAIRVGAGRSGRYRGGVAAVRTLGYTCSLRWERHLAARIQSPVHYYYCIKCKLNFRASLKPVGRFHAERTPGNIVILIHYGRSVE